MRVKPSHPKHDNSNSRVFLNLISPPAYKRQLVHPQLCLQPLGGQCWKQETLNSIVTRCRYFPTQALCCSRFWKLSDESCICLKKAERIVLAKNVQMLSLSIQTVLAKKNNTTRTKSPHPRVKRSSRIVSHSHWLLLLSLFS